MQIVTVAPAANAPVHAEEITKAAAFAQERAEREARLQAAAVRDADQGRLDVRLRLPLGRAARRHRHRQLDRHPDLAAADGVVIDAGPTAGYGAWVKLRHADGTVTLYGHVNTWLVSIGSA